MGKDFGRQFVIVTGASAGIGKELGLVDWLAMKAFLEPAARRAKAAQKAIDQKEG